MATIEINAPAKLNLYLHVTGRRDDGFHLVDTLIAFCEFGDKVTVRPADGIELAASGPFADEVPDGDENLVTRALRLMREKSGAIGGGAVELEKNIPLASGVGGGSTDAASAMLGVNRLWADDGLAGGRARNAISNSGVARFNRDSDR